MLLLLKSIAANLFTASCVEASWDEGRDQRAELTNQRTNTQLEVEIIKFVLRERVLTQLEVEIFDSPILASWKLDRSDQLTNVYFNISL